MNKEYTKWVKYLNEGVKIWQLPEYERPRGIKIVGVVPDLHVPYHNKKAIEFLVDTFVQRGVTDIVLIGDVFDNYWYSKKYTKNYNILGPTETKMETQKVLNQLSREFPYAKFVIGNHEVRMVSTTSDDFFDDLEGAIRSTYTISKGWEFNQQFIIDDVCYIHGTGVSGQNAALTMLRTKRMSTVIGHTHSFGSVQYSNNGIETSFGMNVGCLVDLNAPVFDYGINNREKPVLGCGVVYNSSYAEFVPLL